MEGRVAKLGGEGLEPDRHEGVDVDGRLLGRPNALVAAVGVREADARGLIQAARSGESEEALRAHKRSVALLDHDHGLYSSVTGESLLARTTLHGPSSISIPVNDEQPGPPGDCQPRTQSTAAHR